MALAINNIPQNPPVNTVSLASQQAFLSQILSTLHKVLTEAYNAQGGNTSANTQGGNTSSFEEGTTEQLPLDKEDTTTSTPSQNSSFSTGPVGYAQLGQIMSNLSTTIGWLQSKVAEFGEQTSLSEVNISNSLSQLDATLVQQTSQNVQSEENESGWDKIWHDVGKTFGIVFTLAVLGVSAFSGQWEMFGVVAAVAVYMHSGASKEVAKGITAGLEAVFPQLKDTTEGQNIATAIGDVVSDLIGIVGSVATGKGFSAIASASEDANMIAKSVKDVASEGIEMTDLSSDAPKSMPKEDPVETNKSIMGKLKDTMSKLNVFSKFSATTNEALFATAQALQSTQTTEAIAKAIPGAGENAPKIAQAITDVLGLIVTLGSISSLATSMPKTSHMATHAFNVLNGVETAAKLGQGVAGGAQAIYQGEMAMNTYELEGVDQATMEVLATAMSMQSASQKQTTEMITSTVTSSSQGLMSVISSLGAALQEYSQETNQ